MRKTEDTVFYSNIELNGVWFRQNRFKTVYCFFFLSEGNHFYLYEINETGIKVVSEKLSRLNGITSKVVLKWYRIITGD